MKYCERKAGGMALLLLLLTVFGCNSSRNAVTAPTVVITPDAPLPVVKPKPPGSKFPYRPSEKREFDLLHTRLEVAFDWEKEQMPGKARLRMRPYFHEKKELILDAKGFIINKVGLFEGGEVKPLPYTYDNEFLRITLDRTYTRQETLEVYVDYIARPTALDTLLPPNSPKDQGLYFINPRGKTPNKPRQIWTQGESYGSPAWFPTFDQTNERCTQEIYMTVADSFQTLSNGVLVNSTRNGDGTRTDYWRMNLPHAPYLFAMVVGEFAVIKDEWRGREVSYYVEHEYEPYARLIFGNTPEMLEFFSERLGVEYPWEKYGQAVVRDFVSGAMENTSATIHFGALQHDAREHLDNTYEDYISHELFHQWFGDLVTCESWANLTLNEGFATYGEYIWKAHKYGLPAATEHLLGDRRSYLYEATRKQVPLIRYHHKDADAMFDAHSYQKGGQVIHMLRKLLGDDAFFASVKHYLAKHAYTAVEIHDLRMAFETTTGEDLHWFFDQWFLAAGHPVVEIERSWKDGAYHLHMQQLQDTDRYPLFRLPIELDFGTGTQRQRRQVWMESADTTFVFPLPAKPDFVVVDPEKSLLLQVRSDDNKLTAWTAQLRNSQHYAEQQEAMQALKKDSLTDPALDATLRMLGDPYLGTRALATEVLQGYSGPRLNEVMTRIRPLLNDPEARVRGAALSFVESRKEALEAALSPSDMESLTSVVAERTTDSSYSVQMYALRTLKSYDAPKALITAKQLLDNPAPRLVREIASILQEQNDPAALDFVTQQYRHQSSMAGKIGAISDLGDFLQDKEDPLLGKGLDLLMEIAKQETQVYVRYIAVRSLCGKLSEIPRVREFIEKESDNEPSKFIYNLYKSALEKDKED